MKRIMMMLLGIVTFCASAAVPADSVKVPEVTENVHVLHTYDRYINALDSLVTHYSRWHYMQPDTLSNPYYFQLLASPTFYSAPLHRLFSLSAPDDSCSRLQRQVDEALAYVYAQSPWLIVNDERSVADVGDIESEPAGDFKPKVNLVERTKLVVPDVSSEELVEEWEVEVRKPNFWKCKADVSLQLMQTYVSDNWYKGGESNNSWQTRVYLEAIYNNKQKVIWNNSLEAKLGFYTTKNDEKHKFKTNQNSLRLINKLGLRATKHWYYTLLLQSWTQMYPQYDNNSDNVYTDFMSPFESTFSIGMEYSLKVKRFSMDATISPFACNLKYVDRKKLSQRYGVYANKHARFGFGSNITMNYNWNIASNISWKGRVYYYTDYSKAQLEWENTFNLKVNKYLTTKIFLYPRFDDSVNRKEGDSYFQFNEQLTFGLEMSF